jgi:hypothetical protein
MYDLVMQVRGGVIFLLHTVKRLVVVTTRLEFSILCFLNLLMRLALEEILQTRPVLPYFALPRPMLTHSVRHLAITRQNQTKDDGTTDHNQDLPNNYQASFRPLHIMEPKLASQVFHQLTFKT